MRTFALPLLALGLIACGNQEAPSSDTTDLTNGTSASATSASGGVAPGSSTDAVVALGMTEDQLRDADLVGADGQELGDVEAVVAAADGTITHLLVEIEDSSPDRYVNVPVEGLEAFDNRGDRDIRTTMTRDQLMALPEVRR